MKSITKKLICCLSILGIALCGCSEGDFDGSTSGSTSQSTSTSLEPIKIVTLAGEGVPSSELGVNGNVYIDVLNWEFYLKKNNVWTLVESIDNPYNLSIIDTYLNEDQELIIELSDETIVNVGKLSDESDHVVNFYVSDTLVDTQIIENGSKATNPSVEKATVKDWYVNQTLTKKWDLEKYIVTTNLTLHADYDAEKHTVSFFDENEREIDINGNITITKELKSIIGSKVELLPEETLSIKNRGIVFNSEEHEYISKINISISDDEFGSAKVYCGNHPLSINEKADLVAGENTITFDDQKVEYFVIQNTGADFVIDSMNIEYEAKFESETEVGLPKVIIDTKNGAPIDSRIDYTKCKVSTEGANKDVEELDGKIKIRGNSTAVCPKKPYRIKLDKKNSLFGYAKSKNYSLLADYMDGSRIHNYSALTFAKMLNGEDAFSVTPTRVNVYINDEYQGVYLFCEHIDEKEAALGIEQDEMWNLPFEETNFYIERDQSTAQDTSEIEGETYFKVNLENYTPETYVFALKYPEKESFVEELNDGTEVLHEDEFNAFFNNLKNYVTEVCNAFVDYSLSNDGFEGIDELVDINSLAMYGIVDQVFKEADHKSKSFKMFKTVGEKLKFGPSWDYDSCVMGLPWTGTFIEYPFVSGNPNYNASFGEKWSNLLFNDLTNGRPIFKDIWDNLITNNLEDYIKDIDADISTLSYFLTGECDLWMEGKYYSAFDNLLYARHFIDGNINYLKTSIYH